MSKLTHVTLTGVDEKTDLVRVAGLSLDYPLVEWGFLYSPKRQGLGGRYPSVQMLREAFQTLPRMFAWACTFAGQGSQDCSAAMWK